MLTAMLAYQASEDHEAVSRQERTVFPERGGFGPGGPMPTSWPACVTPPRNMGDYLQEVLQREAQQRQQPPQPARRPQN